MKINGKKIEDPYVHQVFIDRGSKEKSFHVKCKAVLSFADFEKMVPEPKAPWVTKPGQEPFENVEDKGFKEKLWERFLMRKWWMRIQSLRATPGLEFETVKLDDPSTWQFLHKELVESGLAPAEVSRIFNTIEAANALDEAKLKAAEKDFLSGDQ